MRILEKRLEANTINALRNRIWALALKAGPHAQADLERKISEIALTERRDRERLNALRDIASKKANHGRTIEKE